MYITLTYLLTYLQQNIIIILTIRFNRRLIDLPPEKQEENKAYQLLRLMEYLNELPIIQLVIDFVEADDVTS